MHHRCVCVCVCVCVSIFLNAVESVIKHISSHSSVPPPLYFYVHEANFPSSSIMQPKLQYINTCQWRSPLWNAAAVRYNKYMDKTNWCEDKSTFILKFKAKSCTLSNLQKYIYLKDFSTLSGIMCLFPDSSTLSFRTGQLWAAVFPHMTLGTCLLFRLRNPWWQ